MMRKFLFVLFLLVTGYWSLVTNVYAKDITILYTGETHAMLYPCDCPKEPDGGIARRATLINQLRKDNPDCLLLDSGGFFAGGLMDAYTQNTQLDSKRSIVNLKAMELMKYDAVAIGDDEFNFGKEFLLDNINKTHLTFLSCNIKSNKILSYIIKEVAGVKIGIIGVSPLFAKQKAGNLEFIEPKTAVARQVAELKKRGANFIVLLSHLGETVDLNLINDVQTIDILIVGHSRAKEESFTKVGNTLILRPFWEGRRLGKVSLKLEDNKIVDYKVQDLRLSDEISDDPGILSILPKCFSDNNCKKEGFIGSCQDPGSLNARCLFTKANKIKLLTITARDCVTCETETMVDFLKKQFPGLITSYLYFPDKKANNLIKDFSIFSLPVYLLGKGIEKEKNFDSLKANLERKGDFYMLKPSFTGFSYLLNRKKIKGKMDLIISLYDKTTPELLDTINEFNPVVHFLAIEQKDRFDAPKGNLEVEDILRAVCVQKYYPQKFWDYISCRAKNINSSWWEDCLGNFDTYRIKYCARSQEGKTLLRENISLNKELQIMLGPTYLVDNQEIFGSKDVPTKEELKTVIKR